MPLLISPAPGTFQREAEISHLGARQCVRYGNGMCARAEGKAPMAMRKRPPSPCMERTDYTAAGGPQRALVPQPSEEPAHSACQLHRRQRYSVQLQQ